MRLLDSLDNPYFSAGFGLAALGVSAALFKRASVLAITQAQKRLITSLEIPSKDTAYPWMLEWLTKNRATINHKNCKSSPFHSSSVVNYLYQKFKPPPPDKLSIATTFRRRENGSSETEFALIPGIGSYFFKYQNAWFYVERSRERLIFQQIHNNDRPEIRKPLGNNHIIHSFIGQALFSQMLQDAKNEALSKEVGKTVIFTSFGHEWRPFGKPRRKRPFDSVVLDGDIAKNLLTDVKKFLENGNWYYDRGIPYRRGYLLHGPPGSGKTSFIQCLAGQLEYNICVLNLGERGMTDDRLSHLLSNTPPQSIILLEDIDAAFPNRSAQLNQLDQKQGITSLLTLSGLLNALDGVASSEERIIFMTTNHVDKLDPALIRPGRVDVKQLVDHASDEQIIKMFKRFYSSGSEKTEDYSEMFINAVKRSIEKGDINQHLSTAQLQGHFVFYKDNPEAAIENVDKI